MKTILNLTKIYFKEGIIGLLGGREKKKDNSGGMLLLFLLVLTMASMGYSFWLIASQMQVFGYASNIIFIGLILSVVLSLMMSLMDTQGYLYNTRDYETLASMPIKYSYIVTAKYLSAYLVTATYSLMMSLPAFVVYFILCPVTIPGLIFAMVALIILPAFSQLISSVVSWLVNLVSSKMQNKTLFRTIVSLIVVFAFSVFIYFANSDVLSVAFAVEIPLWFKIVFAHIHFIYLAITLQSFVYFLAAFGICLLFAGVSICVVMLGFKKINSSFITTKTKQNNKPLQYKRNSTYKGLLKKEATLLFNSPVYCINTLMGPFMSVVVVAVCISMLLQQDASVPLLVEIFTPICVFGATMTVGIAPTTAVSISIEGEKFYTIKALPISFKKIAFSKIMLCVLISLPLMLIISIVFAIVVKASIVLTILIVIYEILTVLTQAVLGLLINLKHPKLQWTNESQAVKQSASMLITMFANMALSVLPMALFFVCLMNIENISINVYMFIVTVVMAVLLCLFSGILVAKGEKMYNDIS